jgi:hypothetical protein
VTSSNRDVILRHNRFLNGSVNIKPKYSDVYVENNYFISFTDVSKGSTSYVYIQRILADGITTGYTNETYRPEGKLIRSDFSAFMARALDDKFKVVGQ